MFFLAIYCKRRNGFPPIITPKSVQRLIRSWKNTALRRPMRRCPCVRTEYVAEVNGVKLIRNSNSRAQRQSSAGPTISDGMSRQIQTTFGVGSWFRLIYENGGWQRDDDWAHWSNDSRFTAQTSQHNSRPVTLATQMIRVLKNHSKQSILA